MKMPITLRQCLNTKVKSNSAKEEGMAMVISLLMGVVLMAGSTGLLVRQLMARKLGASESYQQMAESASLSGLNRIISDLNGDNRDLYTGFLLSLNNGENQWGWGQPNTAGFELVELCTPVNNYIGAYPSQTTAEAPEVALNQGTMRADGINGDIQITYRLRSYNTTATAGSGEGTFYVEGIVKRNDNILARALLRRSLYVNSKVPGAGDWSVMSGYSLRLNNTDIDGPGHIFYLTNSPGSYSASRYATSCRDDKLLESVGASNSSLAGKDLINQIWPININTSQRGVSGMPPEILFEKDPVNDTTRDSNGSMIRMWSIDDSPPAPDDRDGDGKIDMEPDGITADGLKPILYPALPCGETICVRDADKASVGGYTKDNPGDFRTLGEEGISIDSDAAIIKLTTNNVCEGSDKFDCHIYIDHVKLSTKKLHIETSESRAVVLKLEQPMAYPDDQNITRAINVGEEAELCAVNRGSSTCTKSPERLIVFSAGAGMPQDSCNTIERSLRFSGDSLPYALIYMPTGTVRPTNATLSGLLWASSICVVDENNLPSSFTLKTEANGIPIVQRANDAWGWVERFNYPGYGRMVARAIRGTSLDTFERW